ncbi:MAG: outer membrane beta-barrel protein [Saprospiraceae bacterium]
MKYLIVVAIVFFLQSLSAQSFTLIGQITDSSNLALDKASVVVMSLKDSTLMGFGNTNIHGAFKIENLTENEILLQISYTGYITHLQQIRISNSDKIHDIGKIMLNSQSFLLPELEVKSMNSAIRMGRDTIEYNAASFKVSDGSVVEDLLKKLPGVEVERDGSVKAYGKTVENVMVDGKEFFGKDTRIATKNLEADAVNKVQIFDKKSERAAFTGVEDGHSEKTINLQLKENRRNGYFGNCSAGLGIENKATAKLNLNQFKPQSRFSLIASANNTNEQGFSMQEYIDFMGGIGAFMSGSGGNVRVELNGDSGLPIGGMGRLQGVQTSYSGGINYSHDFSKNTEITSSLFHSQFKNNLRQFNTKYSISDFSYYNSIEENIQNSGNNVQAVNMRLKHKIDSSQYLVFRLQGGLSASELKNKQDAQTFQNPSEFLNSSAIENLISANGIKLNSSLQWMKKIAKPGRSLVVDLSGRINNSESEGFLNTRTLFYSQPTIVDSIHQRQPITNLAGNYEGSVSYTEPIGRKKYIEFNLRHSDLLNQSNNRYFDILENNQEINNEFLSNKYSSEYKINSGGLNFLYSKNKYHLNAGVQFQSSELSGEIKNGQHDVISKKYHSLLPSLFGDYKIGMANQLSFSYETSLQQPGILQLQPNINNLDPLNLYSGNPDLNAEYNHELRINYFKYDQFNFRSLFASLTSDYTKNRITELVQIDSLYRRIIQPVNVNYEKDLRGVVDFNTPIRPLGINTRYKVGTSVSDGIVYINSIKNQRLQWNYSIKFSIENRNKEKFDGLIGWKYSNNKTNYSESLINNQTFAETNWFAELTYNPWVKFAVKSNFEYQKFSSSAYPETISIPLWELELSQYFLKNNRLKVQFKIVDILNKNRGIERRTQLNYLLEQRSNVLGRYALIQLAYSIRGFSASKKDGIEIKFEN